MAELSITYTLTPPNVAAVQFTPTGPYMLEKITGLDAADRRTSSEPRPAADGLISYPTRRGGRIVTVEGFILGSGATDALAQADLNTKTDALVMALDEIDNADAVLSWTPSGSTARQMNVRLIDDYVVEPADGMPHVRRFLFTLLCASGQIVGTTSTTTEVTADGSVTFDNGGTAKSFPILRLYGPCTACKVVVNSARTLSLSGFNLSSGNYIEIDTLQETLRINGDPSRQITSALDLVISEMPWMRPGSNTFNVTFTGEAAGTKLQIISRPAFASG